MVVAVFFAVHERLEVLKIFLAGLERLQKDHPDIEFIPFAVYSDDSEGAILKKHGVRSFKHENRPLGRKKNAGLWELLKLDWDYMMEVGSDDLINSKLIDVYRPLWANGVDCFGVKQCYFIETDTGRVAYWSHHYAIGAGRCIRRGVFDDLGHRWRIRYRHSTSGPDGRFGKGKEVVYVKRVAEALINNGTCEKVGEETDPFGLWTDTKEIALDGDSELRLGVNGFRVNPIDVGEEPMVIDLKSGHNIHGFKAFEPCTAGMKWVLKDFSKKERDAIWKL